MPPFALIDGSDLGIINASCPPFVFRGEGPLHPSQPCPNPPSIIEISLLLIDTIGTLTEIFEGKGSDPRVLVPSPQGYADEAGFVPPQPPLPILCQLQCTTDLEGTCRKSFRSTRSKAKRDHKDASESIPFERPTSAKADQRRESPSQRSTAAKRPRLRKDTEKRHCNAPREEDKRK
eukprot:scaffold587_cov339-Pavlova_lutheri.AAC.16